MTDKPKRLKPPPGSVEMTDLRGKIIIMRFADPDPNTKDFGEIAVLEPSPTAKPLSIRELIDKPKRPPKPR